MKFVDEVIIDVSSGRGGDGCASFRREKFIEFGGPNGGDGGRGGDVIIATDNSINTLVDFRYTRRFRAQNGKRGKGSDCYGASGKSIYLKVPVGTLIYNDDTDLLIADLTEDNTEIVITKGGKGGLGNLHFKSSTNRSPRKFTMGEPGQSYRLRLELKLLADVGLLGLPNAGKSSLICSISAATPKVSDYPFTTLHPNLGVVSAIAGSFVVADIPGLIEGASEGSGLGCSFLKHLQRTKLLLHVIDVALDSVQEVVDSALMIINELKKYDSSLYNKPRYFVFNKIDMLTVDKDKYIDNILHKICLVDNSTCIDYVFSLSAVDGSDKSKFCNNIFNIIKQTSITENNKDSTTSKPLLQP